MASNAEMLRLIGHASAKLNSSRLAIVNRATDAVVRGHVDAAVMAMAYAEAILDMVASCVMPDDADGEVE